ncbi:MULTISPECIES: chromate efflux transporter [unclassified Rhizobium]|uniref:chromate efflux transporter n=1 Tax=unclassified Rhizobium TaxID=2613769 RepID=UPI0006FB8D59|nr:MULTISPECIES: chromate efflux transporter [unclassified Rhizobium]KQV43764.1 chromate transporter [Rhizobium sp. Root1212]KRD37948.1 chromate transporter [Rhizobium sp. Root268]
MDIADQDDRNVTPTRPGFKEAAGVWAKIGLLGFGGPAGQIALMHRELVEERRWVSASRFLHALNYCMLLPGPEAQQLSIYIGWLLHGTRGGIVAGTLFVLPGFIVITGLSLLYALYHQSGWLEGLFFGLKAAVLAIVVEAVVRLGKRALKGNFSRAIAAVSFLALFVFKVPFPLVILAAAIAGYLVAKFTATAGSPFSPRAEGKTGGAGWRRAARVLALWLALWTAPFILIAVLAGTDSVFIAIGLFFSKMAVVTFGGAYAVLSYVAQQAVETHHWLLPGEMLDGLALAETTPGPLVLVLSFVGFMGAMRGATGLDPLLAGVLGAALTTWVTFVPCFLWIFLGAPYVEGLRQNRVLSAALAAISAAVTGVILNLALWFGLHVLFAGTTELDWGPLSLTLPDLASFRPVAFLLTVLALAVTFIGRAGVLPVLAICSVAGWLTSLI